MQTASGTALTMCTRHVPSLTGSFAVLHEQHGRVEHVDKAALDQRSANSSFGARAVERWSQMGSSLVKRYEPFVAREVALAQDFPGRRLLFLRTRAAGR